MSRRPAKQPDFHRVGKGRPPLRTRWKRGQSGNPRGRPKGRRSIGKVLHDVTEQKVTVTENGKTRRMSAFEVMMRQLAKDAMQKDQGALKLFVSMMDRYYSDLTESAVTPEREEVLAEDREILARYLGTPSASEVIEGSQTRR